MKRIERGVTRLAVGDPEGIERLRAATQD